MPTLETTFKSGAGEGDDCRRASDIVEEEEIASRMPHSDFPLPKEAALDWLDRNRSTLLDGKQSIRGKARVIGLPKMQGIDTFRRLGKASRRIRLFPKVSRSFQKSEILAFTEPGSPEVSCVGKVRFNTSQGSNSNQQSRKPVEAPKKRRGLYAMLKQLFQKKQEEAAGGEPPSSLISRKSAPPAFTGPVGEPTGMEQVKRFASSRRST